MAPTIKAVFFDFMGTCLDWHASIVQALPSDLSESQKSTFALHWRQAYFDYNADRIANGEPVENFDETQRKVLDSFLLQPEHADIKSLFTAQIKTRLVSAWHNQPAWPDVSSGIKQIKADHNLEVFVHANGSTRLQLDIVRSAGLQGHFDMLFSSELLGMYKPAPEMYLKGCELLNLKPEEILMVAAHAYDLRGAKAVGMKTVYVCRWTDDIHEDQELIRMENDGYLDGMGQLSEAIAGLR